MKSTIVRLTFPLFCGAVLMLLMPALFSLPLLIRLDMAATFAAIVYLHGLRRIPADPPTKGALTVFGKRVGEALDEGWTELPFFPYVYGFVSVEVTREPREFSTDVRTPEDNALSAVPIAYTYYIINLVNFLNNGGAKGVEEQIEGKLRERTREWASSSEEGPGTWEELRKSSLEALSTLTKTIGYNHVTEIPAYAQGVPTIIWMRYFMKPRPEKSITENEKKWVGEDGRWTRVEEVIKGFSRDDEEGEKMKKELKDAVEKRRQEVKDLRAGQGKNIIMDDLGVAIPRLNMGDVEVKGETAKAAEEMAKEIQQRRGEVFEVKTDILKAKELVTMMKEERKTMSMDEAYRIVLEWKATREGHGFTIPGLAPEAAKIIAAFFGKTAPAAIH